MQTNKPKLFVLELQEFILHQLYLEELLLRKTQDNFCLLNMGSNQAVVMGISKKAEAELHPTFFSNPIPLIQRFSGGGTVIIDENTFFFTLIMNKSEHSFPAFPERIMKYLEPIFQKAVPSIVLKENDFVIGTKKVAGNAQYLTKARWLHHTSFLWSFNKKNMDMLQLPQQAPAYRQARSHDDFLTTLKDHGLNKAQLFMQVKTSLEYFFEVSYLNKAQLPLFPPCTFSTKLIDKTSFTLNQIPA